MSERREGADPEAKPHALDLTCKARGSGWGFNVQIVRVEDGGRNGSMPERAQPILTQPVVGKGKGGYTGSRPDRAQPLPMTQIQGGIVMQVIALAYHRGMHPGRPCMIQPLMLERATRTIC